jgi:hypothetical protein
MHAHTKVPELERIRLASDGCASKVEKRYDNLQHVCTSIFVYGQKREDSPARFFNQRAFPTCFPVDGAPKQGCELDKFKSTEHALKCILVGSQIRILIDLTCIRQQYRVIFIYFCQLCVSIQWCYSRMAMRLKQLQLYVLAGTRILGDKYHLSPGPVSLHYTLLQTLDINLITHFKCPPFTVTSIWVELPSPSYFDIAVPNDLRRSSLPDAKVEVAVYSFLHHISRSLC